MKSILSENTCKKVDDLNVLIGQWINNYYMQNKDDEHKHDWMEINHHLLKEKKTVYGLNFIFKLTWKLKLYVFIFFFFENVNVSDWTTTENTNDLANNVYRWEACSSFISYKGRPCWTFYELLIFNNTFITLSRYNFSVANISVYQIAENVVFILQVMCFPLFTQVGLIFW